MYFYGAPIIGIKRFRVQSLRKLLDDACAVLVLPAKRQHVEAHICTRFLPIPPHVMAVPVEHDVPVLAATSEVLGDRGFDDSLTKIVHGPSSKQRHVAHILHMSARVPSYSARGLSLRTHMHATTSHTFLGISDIPGSL